MSHGDPERGDGGWARRILAALLPDDDWSREFLAELDEERDRVAYRARLWYVRRLLSLRTLRFVWLVRRRRRAAAEPRLAGLAQDLRHAARGVVREPRTAVFIVLTLALGTGATAAMYGVAERLFLSGPRHVRAHEELERLYLTFEESPIGERVTAWIPYLTANAIQEEVEAFGSLTLYRVADELVRVGSEVRTLSVSEVDGRYFETLGTVPWVGRFFGADGTGAEGASAVISHALAGSVFGDPSAALGRPLELADRAFTVAGVAPPGFAGPSLERVDVWVPPDVRRLGNRNWRVVARLPSGPGRAALVARATDEAQAVHERTYPGRSFTWASEGEIMLADVSSDDAGQVAAEASVARLLLALVVLSLLIACANVVNLLLARATRRQNELVVRMALGIGRRRLAQLLIGESLLLGLAGGVLSVPVAFVAGTVLRGVLLPQVAWGASPLDLQVLGMTGAIATITGVALGLLPARRVLRSDLASGLATDRHSVGPGRIRAHGLLAIGQVTLAASLLMCAGLFVKSFWTMRVTDLGVVAADVYAVTLRSLDPGALRDGSDAERDVYQQALDAVRAVPGGERTAVAVGVPFLSTFGASIAVPGRDTIPELPGGGPFVSAVGGRYFDAVGTALLRGRPITDEDLRRGERVAVVSESTAATLWPGQDPLGACVRVEWQQSECSTVVGVAADVHRAGYREPPSIQLYIPLGQQTGFSGTTLLLRPTGGPEVLARARERLRSLDGRVEYVDVASLTSLIEAQIRPWRLGAVVLSLAAALAATISVIGVYGVLSFVVAQRRREIGVRMALGASRPSIRGLVVRAGLLASGAGVAVGIGAVVGGGRWLGPLLFETSVLDPWIMVAVAATLVTAAVVACLLPARQAAAVDPLACLRGEG